MTKLDEMSEGGRWLLAYLERKAVENGGLVSRREMGDHGQACARGWNQIGFIDLGRVAIGERITRRLWVRLSDDAWAVAAELLKLPPQVAEQRRSSAETTWGARTWRTTCERDDE